MQQFTGDWLSHSLLSNKGCVVFEHRKAAKQELDLLLYLYLRNRLKTIRLKYYPFATADKNTLKNTCMVQKDVIWAEGIASLFMWYYVHHLKKKKNSGHLNSNKGRYS